MNTQRNEHLPLKGANLRQVFIWAALVCALVLLVEQRVQAQPVKFSITFTNDTEKDVIYVLRGDIKGSPKGRTSRLAAGDMRTHSGTVGKKVQMIVRISQKSKWGPKYKLENGKNYEFRLNKEGKLQIFPKGKKVALQPGEDND